MKDARRGFCWQAVSAVRLLHATYGAKRLTTAIAIYQALSYAANEARTRDGFEATRAEISGWCGASKRTIDRYAREFRGLGLLEVERRSEGGLNLPNRWRLIDPDSGAATDTTPAASDTTVAQPSAPTVAQPTARGTEERGKEGEEGGTSPRDQRGKVAELHPKRRGHYGGAVQRG